MRLAVIGLGRAGLPAAAELARRGHRVQGVDVDPGVVASIEAGRASFHEPGLDALVGRMRRDGRLRASTRLDSAASARVCFVCVGTDASARGLDIAGVLSVCRALARLPEPPGGRIIAVRSTLPPGAARARIAPALPARARALLCVTPEFSREGSALSDLRRRRAVIGARSAVAARVLRRVLSWTPAPAFETDWATAELLKCSDNAFHALKAAFANETGVVAAALGADGDAVLSVLRSDRVLNASGAYLRPGNAYGGPCLRKDLAALTAAARAAGAAPLLLESVGRSNESRLRETAAALARRARRIAVLGLQFKAGTRDARGSIGLRVAALLAARGAEVTAHDPHARARAPRGVRLEPDARRACAGAGLVVFAPGADAACRAAARGRRTVELR